MLNIRKIICFILIFMILVIMTAFSVITNVTEHSESQLYDASMIERPAWLDVNQKVSEAGLQYSRLKKERPDSSYRTALSDEEKMKYDKIERMFRTMTPDAFIENTSYTELGKIIEIVLFDNPDIFWISKWMALPVSHTKMWLHPLYLDYDFDNVKSTHKKYIAEIEDSVRRTSQADDAAYSEMLLASRLLNVACNKLEYGKNENSQTIKAFFGANNGYTVCTGYSKIYTLLCRACGIECYSVFGHTDNRTAWPPSHAWNVLRIDNRVAYTDPSAFDQHVNILANCVTTNTKGFSKSHKVIEDFADLPIIVDGQDEGNKNFDWSFPENANGVLAYRIFGDETLH